MIEDIEDTNTPGHRCPREKVGRDDRGGRVLHDAAHVGIELPIALKAESRRNPLPDYRTNPDDHSDSSRATCTRTVSSSDFSVSRLRRTASTTSRSLAEHPASAIRASCSGMYNVLPALILDRDRLRLASLRAAESPQLDPRLGAAREEGQERETMRRCIVVDREGDGDEVPCLLSLVLNRADRLIRLGIHGLVEADADRQ